MFFLTRWRASLAISECLVEGGRTEDLIQSAAKHIFMTVSSKALRPIFNDQSPMPQPAGLPPSSLSDVTGHCRSN